VTSGTSVQLTSGTTVQLTSGTSVQQTPLLVAMVPDREARNRQIFREFLGDHKLMRHDGGFAGPANLVPFWQAFRCGEDAHTHPSCHPISPSDVFIEETKLKGCRWVILSSPLSKVDSIIKDMNLAVSTDPLLEHSYCYSERSRFSDIHSRPTLGNTPTLGTKVLPPKRNVVPRSDCRSDHRRSGSATDHGKTTRSGTACRLVPKVGAFPRTVYVWMSEGS
jgi:hypothetical protein